MGTTGDRSDADSTPSRGREALVGTVVAERYRLVQHRSTGANTLIFDAEDLESHRSVTVKLLRPDLAVSAGFRDRFDATLRRAAALSHPNIAAVYDWGVTRIGPNATGYVVIERLSGGSLRDLYDRGRRLTPSQALALGLDVCRGLDHAHRRGFVHGELSPSKLVFGDDRRVRIVDVGLSSLLAEHMWTDPSSVPTHVARYASPEQALSMPIDGTTDVYALSLCLVEGVTGELPFAADSTVATLSARVGRLMPVSADLGPLASVLERAGRPEAAERATAAQFGRALVQTAEKLPRPEPLPLLAPSPFDTPVERLRTPEDPTGGLTRPEPPELLLVPSDDPGTEPSEPSRPDSPGEPETSDPDTAVEPEPEPAVEPEPEPAVEPEPETIVEPEPETIDQPEPEPADTEPLDLVVLDVDEPPTSGPDGVAPVPVTEPVTEPVTAVPPAPTEPIAVVALPTGAGPAESDRGGRGRSIVRRVLIPVLLVLAIAALAVLAMRLFSTPSYEVPEVSGLEESAARAIIDEYGWDVTSEPGRSDEIPDVGRVIRSVPGPGERLARGEPFLLVVSEGPEFRMLPDLVGRNFVDAETALVELALVPDLVEEHDEDVPRGAVVRWSVVDDPDLGPGDQVLPGTEVRVIVSLGPAPRTVPDLTELTTPQATEVLSELRLELAELPPVFDDVIPPGRVAFQDPSPGTEVPRGAAVAVAISQGPDLVIVPELEGTDFAEAQRRLAAVDLIARLEFGASDGTFRSASVDGEPVGPGQTVRRGSQVDLIFL